MTARTLRATRRACRFSPLLWLLAVSSLWSTAAAVAAEVPRVERLPRPEQAAVEAAERIVVEAYDSDLAAVQKDPARLTSLIDRFTEAAERTDQPDRAYALFLQAEKAAINAGRLDQLLGTVDRRAAMFAVSRGTERAKALEDFVKRHTADRAMLQEVTARALQDVVANLANDDVEAATAMLTVAGEINEEALEAARRGRDKLTELKSLGREIVSLRQRVEQRRKLRAAADEANDVLTTRPDDARANATVGVYECLVAGRWFRGLPALAKGDVQDLAAAAKLEIEVLAADEPDPTHVLAAANSWWTAAQGKDRSPEETAQIRRHAADLYRGLAGKLSDPIDAMLATKRAGEGPPQSVNEPGTVNEPFARRRHAARVAAAGGGGADTEGAVDRSLEWLAAHQLPDGGWSFNLSDAPQCRGECGDSGNGAQAEDRTAATALALLPFLGRGYTHQDGPYRKTVEAGIGFLVRAATTGNGKVYGGRASLYTQGIATIAMAECYELTNDKRLAAPTQAMLNFIVQAQDPTGGGWRYQPRQPGDTSASGWQITALKTCSVASLPVSSVTVQKATAFLDSVQVEGGSQYSYMGSGRPTSAMSAVGLHCRLLLGWKTDHPPLLEGTALLSRTGPTTDLYYSYYATQVMHRLGGDAWIAWNTKLKSLLLPRQARAGHEAGSWHEGFDQGVASPAAGRLFSTSLATLMLQQYYR